MTAAAAVISVGLPAPAAAAPNAIKRSGGGPAYRRCSAGRVQDLDVRVVTVETGVITVAVTHVLSINRVLTDFLNNNVDIIDVVDNVRVVVVDLLRHQHRVLRAEASYLRPAARTAMPARP